MRISFLVSLVLVVNLATLCPYLASGSERTLIFSKLHDCKAPILLRASETELNATSVKKSYLLLKQLTEELEKFNRAIDEIKAELGDEPVLRTHLDEKLRQEWSTFLRLRKGLLLLATKYGTALEDVQENSDRPTLQQKKILIQYSASLFLFSSVLRLTNQLRTVNTPIWRKLDEPAPEHGFQAKELSRLHKLIVKKENIETLAQARVAYEMVYSEKLRKERENHWLHKRIGVEHQRVDIDGPSVWKTKLTHVWRAVIETAYKPYYNIQAAIAIWLGDTKYCKRKPAIGHADINEMIKRLEPGDILFERENWFLSNAFLPGFWPHGILYVGTVEDLEELGLATNPVVAKYLEEYAAEDEHGHTRRVIEAISEGVVMSSMEEATDADYICAFRPRVSEEAKKNAIIRAFSHVGKAYDFDFDFFTADKIVCTELIYRSYSDVIEFPLVKIMGRMTLPATEIIRSFSETRGTAAQSMDFIFFLDSNAKTGKTWFADEEAMIRSNSRPGLAFQLKAER